MVGAAVATAAITVIGAVPVTWRVLDGEPEARSEDLSGPAMTAPAADFDNDGAQDVYTTGEFSGAVSVVYGHKGGSDDGGKERKQRLNLDSPGVPGQEGDGVGFAGFTDARDFDKDGYTDLAASVGVTEEENPPANTHTGMVILWGSAKGLSGGTYLKGVPDDYQHTNQEDPLVAGDFTGDGNSDLIVRTGSERGLLKGPFSRDGSPSGSAETPDAFGADKTDPNDLVTAFAADLNGDGADDLVSSYVTSDDGLGNETVETSYAAGGSAGFEEPDSESLPGIDSATTGDVDKDGYTDVILRRVPKGESHSVSGPVEVFHGSEQGPNPARHTELDSDSPGVPEHSKFGSALDAGDADGDGHADVAVGNEYVDDGQKSTVTVLHGSEKGLTGRGARAVNEPSSSVEEPHDEYDTAGNRFGEAVRMGDTNGDGKADLAVGAPRTNEDTGALWVFPAGKAGWPQDSARSYGPRDFGSAKAPDDDRLGTDVR